MNTAISSTDSSPQMNCFQDYNVLLLNCVRLSEVDGLVTLFFSASDIFLYSVVKSKKTMNTHDFCEIKFKVQNLHFELHFGGAVRTTHHERIA